MADDWKLRVFEQKSLWSVFWLSRKSLPKSAFNRVLFWFSFFLIFGLCTWAGVSKPAAYTSIEAFQFSLALAELGFALALGILGFLIAGFSIFASVTRAELFILLAKIPYKETKINRLQFVFFNFLNVFISYIGLLAVSLAVLIGASEHSPLQKLALWVPAWKADYSLYVSLFGIAVLLLWIIAALLKLKSFIWNLYQTVLVTIATEAELAERNAEESN